MLAEELVLRVNGKTKLLGLLGTDLSHSLSPSIHNFSIESLCLDQVYLPLALPQEGLEVALQVLWDLGCVGLNITHPFKGVVPKILGPEGTNLSAVNTLYRGHDGWLATSTDAEGLSRAVTRLGLTFSDLEHLVILGNGGVTASIVEYLAPRCRHAMRLSIFRRRSTMDEHFMAIVGRHSVKVDFYDFEPQILREVLAHAGRHSLLIQATSAPHFGDDLSRFVVSMQRFSGGFVDLVYGADSALYRAAKNLGIRCQNGLPMLIEQARLSQECWWGRSVEYHAIEDHLLR